ncbi:MAG: hypothetical protein ABH839_01605 [Chloroflexota bacterium]
MDWLWRSRETPRDIAPWAFTYMVVTLGVDSDYLNQLKCVERVGFEGGVLVNLIRVFDPRALPPGVRIEDFASLDGYPELILYEGYREKEGDRIHITSWTADSPSPDDAPVES